MKAYRIILSCILAALGFLAGGAGAQVITEFSAGITAGAGPLGITAGPDGNLWFTETTIDRIGRITPAGVVTEFSAGISAGAALRKITAGPDGNLWFTENSGNRIGRITPLGVVTEFSAGIAAGSRPYDIAPGPDGNLWFTEQSGKRIGRITPAGVVTEFSVGSFVNPGGITAGPDGNLWFTECFVFKPFCNGQIGRISPPGIVTPFHHTTIPFLVGITAGPDGNLWFTASKEIGRITPLGVYTDFSAGITAGAGPMGIAAGPDGNLWFTEQIGNRIGRITPLGCVTEFSAGITASAGPHDITLGPDGNLWFTEFGGNRIGRLIVGLKEATCSTTTVASSVNPSKVGQAIVFTASVAGNLPTGTVQFMDSGTNLGTPVGLSGGGVAQFITSTLTRGTHSITTAYSGDANNDPSASSVLLQNVNGFSSTTTVVASVNPSKVGQATVFTATVVGNFPTGTVQFMDDGTKLGTPVGLSGGGAAQFVTSTLTRGKHSITAVYSGDGSNDPSASSVLLQRVGGHNRTEE